MPHTIIETIADQAARVVDLLEKHGLHVPGDSRFATYRRVLESADNSEARTDLPTALEAWSDVEIMRFILEWVPDDSPEAWRRLLREAVKDEAAITPSLTGGSTPGRDKQHELLVGAILRKAGLFEDFGEPDVLGRLGGMRFGVACKRITSPMGIKRAIRGAGRQIRDSGMPGVVVLDTSVAMNRGREPFEASLRGKAADDARVFAGFEGYKAAYEEPIRKRWLKDVPSALGVILMHHAVYCRAGRYIPQHFVSLMPLSTILLGELDFEIIWFRLERGFPADLSHAPVLSSTDVADATAFVRWAEGRKWR